MESFAILAAATQQVIANPVLTAAQCDDLSAFLLRFAIIDFLAGVVIGWFIHDIIRVAAHVGTFLFRLAVAAWEKAHVGGNDV